MPKKRKTTRRTTTRRKTRSRQTASAGQGWSWGLLGLGIGLSVSAFIYLNNRPPATGVPTPAPEQAQPSAKPKVTVSKRDATAEAEAEPRFGFYDMLENYEVVIFEEEAPVQPQVRQTTNEAPGIFVLQAGSFAEYVDADRRKAQLAILGVESGIQKVSVDDKVYHRVRVGPLQDLDEVQRLRRRLADADIDTMVLRVGQ